MADKEDVQTEQQLRRRAAELDALRATEHQQSFSGDQREMTGETSQVSQHPGDVSDFTFQRELSLTTEEILGREANQVRDALRQQQEGTYGTCAICGRPIDPERLRARPEATLCLPCQQRMEAQRVG